MVGSTSWTGSLANGYSIPVGSGTQLLDIAMRQISTRSSVTFNENVTVDQSDLLLTGVNVPSYNVTGGTFSYNSTTFTATWTLPQSIGADKLMLALNADGSDPIHDAAGNHLDGEWTNPTSTTSTSGSVYPSGNGTAGGNFDFRFNVLPGDANQDSVVDVTDLGSVGRIGSRPARGGRRAISTATGWSTSPTLEPSGRTGKRLCPRATRRRDHSRPRRRCQKQSRRQSWPLRQAEVRR